MATIQDVFSHIYTTEAHLSEVPIKNGQIVLCVDSEKLYIDHGSNRVSISDVVQVETQTALPLAPLDKFYITQDTGDVYFYINDEWKKLTDTIKDYTAFEVYANDSVISPGEHEVLGTITVEIPVQMTETFALRTTTPEADSDVVVDWGDGTIQKVKDGEHGGYTGPDGEGRYVAKMTHTYGTAGKYTVKVYGHDYFCLSHAPSHVSDASNMQCRILADDLPIASHLTNLTAFAYGTLKLVTVQCASYKYLHRTTNHAQMFTNDKNLLSVTGFEDLVMISRGAEGCFQFCENMHTCDFNGVLCSNNPRAMYAMYQNCYALAINIGTFFPTKFVSRALNFTNTFTHMHAMTGTVNAKQLWGDPTIDWQGYSNCFYGCPEEIRAQVPTAWGGTASDPVAYELTVDSITLNGHAANTANGLVILNAQGKVDNTLLPDTSIDLSNYSQNASIKLTSTAGAVDLISNTMEVALYSGTAHVKANVDSVELQGTNLKFNNNAQNTAGGIVVVDKESGKIPDSVLPEATTVDLGNYNGNVSLTASGADQSVSLKYDATSTSGSSYTSTLLLDNSKIDIDANAGNINMMAHTVMVGTLQRTLQTAMINASNLQINVTNLLFNSHPTNTASGLVQLDRDGRLPAVDGSQLTNLPAATVDLSNYSTSTIQLTSTDGTIKLINGNNNGSIQLVATNDEYPDRATFQTPGVWDIKLDSYLTKISGTQQMDIEANGSACPVKITAGSNGGDIELEASGTLKYNGADLNSANGLVKLGSDGKIPSNLYDVGGSGTEIDWSNVNATEIKLNGSEGIWLNTIMNDIFLKPQNSAGTLFIDAIDIQFNEVGLNQPTGLVQLGADGKIPVELYDAGGSVDLTNYVSTGQISLTTAKESTLILKADANVPGFENQILLGSDTGVGDGSGVHVSLSSGGYFYVENGYGFYVGTQSAFYEVTMHANQFMFNATSGQIALAASTLIYNGHEQNTGGGLAVIQEDGKLPASILPESSGGGSFDPTNYQGTLNLTNTTDVVNVASLVSNGTNIYLSYSNVENNTIVDLSSNKLDLGVTTAGAGEKITFDLTDGVNITSEIGLKYNGVGLNTAGGLVQVGEDGKIPSSLYEAGSGGDTSALEERVATLEGTVGTLDAAVDEILADYGEGSGALVYRVVASATEPENPTEGMIWIQTE